MYKIKVILGIAFTLLIIASTLVVSSCDDETDQSLISEITTTEVSDVTITTLTTGGEITAPANAQITSRGVVWSNSPKPLLGKASSTTDGMGAGSFQSELTGLELKKYYIRAYATAGGQTYYGNEITFDHGSIIPTFISQGPLEATASTAKIKSTINYTWSDPIIEKGICWGTTNAPNLENDNKIEVTDPSLSFSVSLTNLNTNQIYYARAYAVTQLDVFYGNSIQILLFAPPVYGQVQDIDGNNYKTVTIGNKTWMAQNLAVTKYDDGTPITEMTSAFDFKSTNSGAYIAYEASNSNAETVGYLYNGYVITSNKDVCMKGWHVPTSGEWNQLANALGGIESAGGRMKDVSDLWRVPNTAATNESGFSGLPGGSYCSVCLGNTGIFADFGTDGYWWSSFGDFFYLTNDRADLRTKGSTAANDGLSVRCVKD